MDEELQSLKLDKPGRTKTDDQLVQHTLDTQYENKPVERSVYLLTKGDEIQKLSVIQYLPQLYQFEPSATVNRILPKIQQELASSSAEINIAASRIFKVLIENKVPVNLLGSILQGIEARDQLISTAWVETLLGVIPLLNENQIKNEVLKLAIQKLQPNKAVLYRITCCHLMGKISIHTSTTPQDVKKIILPVVQSLCQDTSFEVRASMASQLVNVAEGLSGLSEIGLIKMTLLPNLVELATDENDVVRTSGIVAVVQLLNYMTTDAITEIIIPLFKQLCTESMSEQDVCYPVIAKEYGNLLTGLQECLSNVDCIWFLKFFKTLSLKGLQGDNVDPTQAVFCRHFCALNLPAITKFTLLKLPAQLDLWYGIFRGLAADPCYIVRKTVGGNIHEVCISLGEECKLIKQDIVKLLRDDAEEVLHLLVPNLGSTLEILCHVGLLSREGSSQTTTEIGRAVLKCQIELSRGTNWRMQTCFLTQLEHLPNCLPSDFIHQHFTPIIFGVATEGKARPVRTQAARALLIFLRYNVKDLQRKWIRDMFIDKMYCSKSCYTRLIYVKLCENALEIFSKKYFKEHFFQALVNLLDDHVSNIRLSAIPFIPKLQAMLLPDDKKLYTALENAIKKIEMSEKDKDVKEIFQNTMKQCQAAKEAAYKPEHLNEERLRQEDEAKVAQGKIIVNTKILEDMPYLPKHFIATGQKAVPGKPLFGSTNTSMTSKSSKTAISRTLSSHSSSSSQSSLSNHRFPIDDIANRIDYKPALSEYTKMCYPRAKNSKDVDWVVSKQKNDQSVNDHELIRTVSVENIETMTEHELRNLETITSNITDDVKVNLRKINKTTHILSEHSNVDKSIKRRSLPISLERLEKENKAAHRKSICSLYISKIPVSEKHIKVKMKKEIKEFKYVESNSERTEENICDILNQKIDIASQFNKVNGANCMEKYSIKDKVEVSNNKTNSRVSHLPVSNRSAGGRH